jgi:hypothetical protein
MVLPDPIAPDTVFPLVTVLGKPEVPATLPAAD